MSMKSYEPNGVTWTQLHDEIWYRVTPTAIYFRVGKTVYTLPAVDKD